jgi:hypothetical protein
LKDTALSLQMRKRICSNLTLFSLFVLLMPQKSCHPGYGFSKPKSFSTIDKY